jgi:hypothetical protein
MQLQRFELSLKARRTKSASTPGSERETVALSNTIQSIEQDAEFRMRVRIQRHEFSFHRDPSRLLCEDSRQGMEAWIKRGRPAVASLTRGTRLVIRSDFVGKKDRLHDCALT